MVYGLPIEWQSLGPAHSWLCLRLKIRQALVNLGVWPTDKNAPNLGDDLNLCNRRQIRAWRLVPPPLPQRCAIKLGIGFNSGLHLRRYLITILDCQCSKRFAKMSTPPNERIDDEPSVMYEPPSIAGCNTHRMMQKRKRSSLQVGRTLLCHRTLILRRRAYRVWWWWWGRS